MIPFVRRPWHESIHMLVKGSARAGTSARALLVDGLFESH